MAQNNDPLSRAIISKNIDPKTGLESSEDPLKRAMKISPSLVKEERVPLGRYGVGESKFDYDIDPMDVHNLEKIRAQRQSGIEQFGAAVNQALIGEIVGGTLEGIGWLGEIDETVDMLQGQEVDLGNWLTDIGKGLHEWSQETTPIYQSYEPGDFAPGKWSWWMSNAPSVASTLSLLIPATGVVKGASMAGKALGISAKLGKSARGWTTAIGQATLSRHMENLMEASGKYDEIYERSLNQGYSEQEARSHASTAASDIYKANWPLIAQDIISYKMLSSSFGKASKGATLAQEKALGNPLFKAATSKTGAMTAELATEGFEEAYQYISAERADDMLKASLDPDYKPRSISDYTKDGEMWTSAFFGMFGAGVHQTVGRFINKKILGQTSEDEDRLNEMMSWAPRHKQMLTEIKKAQDSGDVERFEQFKNELAINMGASSSESGNLQLLIDNLQKVLDDSANEQTKEVIGLDEEDINYIKENVPNYIDVVKEVGDYYQANVKNGFDPDMASRLAAAQAGRKRLAEQRGKLKEQIQDNKKSLEPLGYEELSSNAKDIFDIEIDNNIHASEISLIENILKEDNTKEDRAKFLNNHISKLNGKINDNNKKQAEIYSDPSYTKDQKSADNEILSRITETDDKENFINKETSDYVDNKFKLNNLERAYSYKDQTISAIKEYQTKRDKGELKKPKKVTIPKKSPEQVQEEQAREEIRKETEREVAKKEEERINKVNNDNKNKTISELLPTPDSSIDLVNNETGKITTLKRTGDNYFFIGEDGNSRDITENIKLDKTLTSQGIEGYDISNVINNEEPDPIKQKIDDTNLSPVRSVKDQPRLFSNATSSLGEHLNEGLSSFGFDVKLPENKELDEYLANPDNDLSNAELDFYINYGYEGLRDNKSLLNKLKSGKELTYREDEIDDVPLFARLVVNGKVISDNIFSYIPLDVDRAINDSEYYRTTYVSLPDDVKNKPVGSKERNDAIKAYYNTIRKNERNLRKIVINQLVKGNKVKTNNLLKSRGLILNTDVKKIGEAFNVDYNSIEILVGVGGNEIVNVNNDVVGYHSGGPGGLYYATDKTANGEKILTKLVPQKISKAHSNTIFEAFRQYHNNGEKVLHKSDSTYGDELTNSKILTLLINWGKSTKVTREEIDNALNEDERDFLIEKKAKQIYLEKGVLYYGATSVESYKPYSIDLNNHTKEERDHFAEYLNNNMNYAVRRNIKDFRATMKSPFTINDVSYTQEDIDNRLPYHGFVAKSGFVKTDAGIRENTGSTVHKTEILSNIKTTNDLIIDGKNDIQTKINTSEELPTSPVGETSIEQNQPTVDDIKSIDEIDDMLNNQWDRLHNGNKNYTVANINKEVKWLKKKLGTDLPIHIVEDFIKVVDNTGTKKAFGQVSDGSIYLYRKAEEGTAYHEAFHVVTQYYLTDLELEQLYDNAGSNIKELEGASDTFIEEYLAEKFREYVLSKNTTSLSKRIANFFKQLYDFIYNLFINNDTKVSELTVDKLFDKIEKGQFKKSKTEPINYENYYGYAKLRAVEGYTVEQTHSIVNGLLYRLIHDNNLIDIESVNDKEISYRKVKLHLSKRADEYAKFADKSPAHAQREFLYRDIIKKFNDFQEIVDDRLRVLGINRKQDELNDVNDFEKFDKATYEYNSRDNIRSNLKLYIATLPSSNKPNSYTGFPELVDFQTAWTRLMKDLHSAYDINDVENILRSKVELSPFYKEVYEGRRDKTTGKIIRRGIRDNETFNDELFRTQFEVALSKHRYNFLDLSHEEDGSNNKYNTYKSSITSAKNIIVKEWATQFYEKSGLFDKKDNINIKKLKGLQDYFYKNISNLITREYANKGLIKDYELFVNEIIQLFSKLGVNIPKFTLEEILTDIGNSNKEQGLYEFVKKDGAMYKIFNGFINSAVKGDIKTKNGTKAVGLQLLENDSSFKNLAQHVVEHNDDYINDIVLGPDGANYYIYSESSFLMDFNKLRQDDVYFKNLSNCISNLNSYFCERIRNGAKLDIYTISSYKTGGQSKEYLKLSDQEDFLLKSNLIKDGYLPMPTLADRKSYHIYGGIDVIKIDTFELDSNGKFIIPKKIVELFKGYYLDEYNRIKQVKETIDAAIATGNYRDLIQNIHYFKVNEEGIPILTSKGYSNGRYEGTPLYLAEKTKPNGLRYHVFNEFNKSNYSEEKIRKIISDRIKETIDSAINLGIIEKKTDKKTGKTYLINNLLDQGQYDKYYRQHGKSSNNAISAIIGEYAINTMVSGIETDKLFSGDPSYYKLDYATEDVQKDKIKRINELVAPGTKLRVHYNKGEFKGITQYNVATLQDHEYSNLEKDNKQLYDNLKKMFENVKVNGKKLTDSQIKERLEGYNGTNVTDAQVYITPQMHRQLAMRLGEWTEEQDNAYKLLMSEYETIDGKLTKVKELTNEEKIKAASLVMQPLKFVHYGLYFQDRYAIPIYDKMSLATLFPSMVEGTKLEALYNRMTDSNDPIDMVKFESAVKAGNRPRPKYMNEKEDVNFDYIDNIQTYKQEFKYLRRQQVTEPHDTSHGRMLATQVKKIVMANLKADSKYYIGNEEINVAEVLNKSYGALSRKGFAKVAKTLGLELDKDGNLGKVDINKLYEMLRKEATKNNLPYQVIDALLIKDGKDITDLDTIPDRNWVETRLVSMVAKNVIDIMMHGDAFAQMTTFGLNKTTDDKLKLIDKNGQTEVKVSVGLYQYIIPNYNKISFEEKVQWLNENRDIIEGIGYRIPTQGQNSVISFKVKEFLPESTGNTIILPAEFTALTGSDFDIDKLFLATYNYSLDSDGNLIKTKFIKGDKNGIISSKESLETIWKQTKVVSKNRIIKLENTLDKTDENELSEIDQAYLRDVYPDYIDPLGRVKIEKLAELLKKLNNDYADNNLEKFIKDNKGKDEYDVNTEHAVQNRILDAMKSVIVNPDHVLETKTPLDTFTGKIKKMVTDLRKIKEEDKPLSSLQAYAPVFQSLIKKTYNEAKGGIGPFALNNVHHALGQVVGLKLAIESAHYDFANYDEEGQLVDLSKDLGIDNVFIEDWISALINAHVDVAKDPYIFDLNVNNSTYNIVNYLIRAGVGIKTFPFLVNPGLKDTVDNIDEIRASKENHIYDKYVSRALALSDNNAELIKTKVEYYSNPKNIFSLSLDKLKQSVKENNEDIEWLTMQAGISNITLDFLKDSQELSQNVLISRIDGKKNFGNTYGSIREYDKLYRKHLNETRLVNADKLLNESFISDLKKNTVDTLLNIFSNISLSSTTGFTQMYDVIMSLYGKTNKNLPRNRKILEKELFSAIVSKYFISPSGFNLDSNSIKNLFEGENSVGSKLYALIAKHPELADNYFVKQIRAVSPFTDENKTDLWVFKTLDGDKTDVFQRDAMVDGWESLLEHTNPEVVQVAHDLFNVAFYSSGFNRRLFSFYHNMPIKHLMRRPDHFDKKDTKSYNEFIREQKKALNEGLDSNEMESIINNVLEHNIDLFPFTNVSNKKHKARLVRNPIGIDGKPLVFIINSRNPLPIAGFNDGEYKGILIGYSGKNEYIYKVVSRKGYNAKGHKLFEYGYDGSWLNNDYLYRTNQQIFDILEKEGITNIYPIEVFDIAKLVEDIQVAQEEEKQIVKEPIIEDRKFLNKKIRVDKSKSWEELKNKPVYSKEGVNTMRTSNKENDYKHFGNPFTGSGVKGLVQMPDITSAVKAYEDWLLGNEFELSNLIPSDFNQKYSKQRDWILQQIDSGRLDNANLLYMNTPKADYVHVDVLFDIINDKSNQSVQLELFTNDEEVNKRLKQIPNDITDKAKEQLENLALKKNFDLFDSEIEQLTNCKKR